MSKLLGTLTELVSLIFRKDSQAVTLQPNQSTTYTGSRSFELPPGDASQVIVSATSTGALTNKTIDADLNTITNIENADIKSGANIDRTKVASGTASHVLINDGTGILSSEAALAKVRGGTGADNSSVTFPASGTIPTEASSSILTNKTIDADLNTLSNIDNADIKSGANIDAAKLGTGVVSNTEFDKLNTAGTNAAGELVTTDGTQNISGKTVTDNLVFSSTGAIGIPDGTVAERPGSPIAGHLRFNTDVSSFEGYDGTAWGEIGGGGAGGINYIENSDAEANVDGWVTYADAAGAEPVDGTGGSATTTWTRSTSSPLRGTASFLLTKDAANRQGEGASYDLVLDSADLNKTMQISFDVDATSANFVAGDIGVYVVRDTGGTPALVYPASINIAKAKYTFQTTFVATSDDDYRLIFHVASTNATAYTVKFDNVSVGPVVAALGVPVSDWIAFTPAITDVPGAESGSYKRIGDTCFIQGRVDVSGAVTGVIHFEEALPVGLTENKANMLSGEVVGSCFALDTGTTRHIGVIQYDGTNFVGISQSGTNWSATVPHTWANTDVLGYEFRLPIAEWADSSVHLSQATPEYVSNSSVTNTDDTTSFVYGPAGSLVPTITAVSGTTAPAKKRVRFLTPIQTTDQIVIQVKPEGGLSPWQNVENSEFYRLSHQNNTRYGISWDKVTGSSTDIEISFHKGGSNSRGNTTFASAGTNHPNQASDLWRAVKIPGSVQVASPVTTKYQIKKLTADITVDNTVATDLSFTLVKGKTYRITANITGFVSNAGTYAEVLIKDGATQFGTVTVTDSDTTFFLGYNLSKVHIRTMTDGALTFTLIKDSAGALSGDNTTKETHVIVEELTTHIETTEW